MKYANKGALCIASCILSVTAAGQNDLYRAKGSMPSFYTSAMLSVHLFVKHKFKSHKFCSYARNSQLPSNTCIPGRCNSASKGPLSSYAVPRRIWVIKHVCILYQPECIITWNKEIKSEVYFPNESNECFQWQQTYANFLCVCQGSAHCEELPIVEVSKLTFLIFPSYLTHLFHLFSPPPPSLLLQVQQTLDLGSLEL